MLELASVFCLSEPELFTQYGNFLQLERNSPAQMDTLCQTPF